MATLIVAALVASVFVLPLQSWLGQKDELAEAQSELSILEKANNQIQAENDRLLTPEGIREAAREEIDYVEQGEQRITVSAITPPSAQLPAGWPYELVTRIVELRTAELAAAAAVAPPPAPQP